jgi:hypothetical protein
MKCGLILNRILLANFAFPPAKSWLGKTENFLNSLLIFPLRKFLFLIKEEKFSLFCFSLGREAETMELIVFNSIALAPPARARATQGTPFVTYLYANYSM